jgi:formate dehydrogenase
VYQGGDDRASVEKMVSECDIVTINCPLYAATTHLFDRDMLSKMKKGSYIINTARGKICDRDAIADALESGHLAGDVFAPLDTGNVLG